MPENTIQRSVVIAGRRFDLTSRRVVEALRNVDPEPIVAHYVVIGGKRFPPKQVIGELTGLDRADFTSHQARRTVMRLGFSVGRRRPHVAPPRSERAASMPRVATATRDDLADQLRAVAGQWVAVANGEVLHAATSPHELVSWLTRHGVAAQSMFRAPEDELAVTGIAPL
jgi:hypothetical protein